MQRFTLVVMALALALALAACGASEQDATTAAELNSPAVKNEILWDTWGVPHIYGDSDVAVFKGMGWAQMESHGDLLLRLYGEGRGRAAEYWGEEHLESDRYVRKMGIPARGQAWLELQTPEMRANIEAFAEGINNYARQHPERIADDVEVVLPVTASDVLAHVNRVLHFTFVTRGVLQQADQALSQSVGEVAYTPEQDDQVPGSNAWAIAPSKSASGNPLLVATPHLPWEGLYLFYEQHLVGPDFDVYGSSLIGFPNITIGFNDRLGWTHTVNTYDGADLFNLTVEGNGYQFGDEVREFDTRTETILVKTNDGGTREEALVVKSSVHGPVVAEEGDRAIALRVAGLDRAGAISEWWDMSRASTLQEFETALKRLQYPMFNVLYADADGHIFYLFNGVVPERPFGDVATWRGAVDGSDPSTLWNSYLPYDKLPRVVDPANGWLQNANDPPWTTTAPQSLSADDFPAYLAPERMRGRAQRSTRMLLNDESITFDEAVAYKHDTRVELADRVLDDLLAAVAASTNARAKEAATVLAQWDRTVNANNRGGLLFEAWLTRWMSNPANWATPWSADSPVDTPAGIADTSVAVAYLVEAAGEVEGKYGALDTIWSDVRRARRNGIDLPVGGASGYPLGVFRVAGFIEAEEQKRTVFFGDSYYSVMEFTPEGVRAKVLTAYGNATQPHSPHNGDQLELFSRKEMRPVWKARADVEANTASRTEIQ